MNTAISLFYRTARAETDTIPTAAASLALGIASLGWALDIAFSLGGTVQAAGALVALVPLAAVAGKFMLHPALLAQEMRHPVAGSILPTLAMGLMVISKAAGVHHAGTGEVLWSAAVLLHLLFLLGFILCRVRGFSLTTMVPSWFVPPVGIITAALSSPGGDFALIAKALLTFGLGCFVILLPLMVYRLIFHPEIPDAAKPTIAILAAPASLSLAGYLSVSPEPSPLCVMALLGIALLLTGVIYVAMARLLRLPFTPAYAAFTFPLVISATALHKTTALFDSMPHLAEYAAILRQAALFELGVAVLMVTYVAALYVTAGGKAVCTRLKMKAGMAAASGRGIS